MSCQQFSGMTRCERDGVRWVTAHDGKQYWFCQPHVEIHNRHAADIAAAERRNAPVRLSCWGRLRRAFRRS